MRNWVDVPISGRLFKEWLIEDNAVAARCTKGLPRDSVFIRSWYDDRGDMVHFIFGHPSFEEVCAGHVAPILHIEYEDIGDLTLRDFLRDD